MLTESDVSLIRSQTVRALFLSPSSHTYLLRGGALRHDADTKDVLKGACTRTNYGVFAYVCKWLTLANNNSNITESDASLIYSR
jgi:hypothetical protein